jgi:chromosome segregation ATPase
MAEQATPKKINTEESRLQEMRDLKDAHVKAIRDIDTKTADLAQREKRFEIFVKTETDKLQGLKDRIEREAENLENVRKHWEAKGYVPAAPAPQGANKQQVLDLQKKVTDQGKEILDFQNQITELGNQNQELIDSKAELEKQITELNEKLAAQE